MGLGFVFAFWGGFARSRLLLWFKHQHTSHLSPTPFALPPSPSPHLHVSPSPPLSRLTSSRRQSMSEARLRTSSRRPGVPTSTWPPDSRKAATSTAGSLRASLLSLDEREGGGAGGVVVLALRGACGCGRMRRATAKDRRKQQTNEQQSASPLTCRRRGAGSCIRAPKPRRARRPRGSAWPAPLWATR